MRITFLFLFFLVAAMARGQQVDRVLKVADSLVVTGEYSVAMTIVEKASTSTPDGLSIARLANKKAEIFMSQGKLTDAEAILNTLSNAPWATDVQKSAYLNNLGYLYLNKGRHDLALEKLQQAYTLLQQAKADHSAEGAKCLSRLSLTYLASGKYNQAESNGRIALQLRQELSGEANEDVAAAYNDLGLVYTQSNPDKALEYYEKALAVYQKIHGNEHPKIAIANTNIGGIYRQLELYGDAINNLEAALKIWRKIYPDGHPNEAFVMRNLGQTYIKMNDNKTALTYFEKSLALYRKSFGEKNPDISSTLNQIATIHLRESKFNVALQACQEAIVANTPTFGDKDVNHNPRATDYYNANVLLYSLHLKAKTLDQRHFGLTLNFSDLKLSLSCLQLCDSLIDNIRHHSTDESDKLSLGATAAEVYEDGVRIATAMSEQSTRKRFYLEEAFYFAEKSKSAVLQESIADAQAKSFAGIAPATLDQEKELKSTIAFLTQKLGQKPPVEEEKYLREALFNLNREYQEFTRKLETEYPNYFNLKYNTSSPSVSYLQKMLKPGEAIVSYFIAEASKRIYQFAITPKKFKARNYTLPDGFDKYAKGINNGIYFRDFNSYAESANALNKVLKPIVPVSTRELIIVPAGRLGTIPLEALPLKRKAGSSFSTTTYLGSRYGISYEFSAGLIAQKQRSTSPDNPSIFLCAPIEFAANTHLNELPGTEKEVNAIAELFQSNTREVMTRKQANEGAVKSKSLSKYNYLHFATHGIVDEADPELSRIYLSEDGTEDGNLFAGEIYNLSLNADLAVLSACQTGLGKYSKGEGVIGLSRALVYAGAKNLIVSFWSVSDESTAQLMSDFYRTLLAQKTGNFRNALKSAKSGMMKSKQFSEPYFWAPFILIGF